VESVGHSFDNTFVMPQN